MYVLYGIEIENKNHRIKNMNKKYLFFFITGVLALLLLGCSHQNMGGPDQGWNHMMGYGGFGGMFMWLIWILVAGAIIYFIFSLKKNSPKNDSSAPETHMEILKKRYARGEISKQQFDELKKDLED